MRVRLKGVHSATKKLADGTRRTYYYAWKNGPRIDAEPGTPEFVTAYTEAHKSRKQPAKGTLKALIAYYRGTAEFERLKPSTRKDYVRYIGMIEEKFGTMPIAAIEHPKARGVFKEWRDSMAHKPRMADLAWSVLARILSVAKDRGKISVNPCERGGRLYKANRNDPLWTDDLIVHFNAVASEPLKLALLAALWTGQRQGDLLQLTWSAYDGEKIRLAQDKGGSRVPVPVGTPLKEALDSRRRGANLQILTKSRGQPWTPNGFRASWKKACKKAGVSGVTFHDLRGTAVTRLAVAGASVPQIAAVTGHSLKSVEQILQAHYLGADQRLAEAAIQALERTGNEQK